MSKPELKPKQKCYAVYPDDEVIYGGKISKKVGSKYEVVFDDGDTAVLPRTKVFSESEFDALDVDEDGRLVGETKETGTEPESTEDGDEEEVKVDLDELNRNELKKLIADNDIPIKVTQKMSEADIRKAIVKWNAEQNGEETDGETDGEEEAVDLDTLDRKQLKALIKENELDISVDRKMTDDDIREAIRKAVGGEEGETTEEANVVEEVDLSEMDNEDLCNFVEEKGLDIEDPDEWDDDELREEIKKKLAELPVEKEDKGETDEFDEMERKELKAYIKENDLEITVKREMTDDEVRDLIRETISTSPTGDLDDIIEQVEDVLAKLKSLK